MSNLQLLDKQVSRFLDRCKGPEARPLPPAQWRGWKAEEWPNRLGFDVGPVEVWKHKTAFGCYSDDKCIRISYDRTTDPQRAARLCMSHGLSMDYLNGLDPIEAERLYQSSGEAL